MDISESALKCLSVHFVGNKGLGQELRLSKQPLQLSDKDKLIMTGPFLGRFTNDTNRYHFHHDASLNFNEVYNFCLDMFTESENFHPNSIHIAKHLYDSTEHPRIKDGEVYVCLYENCIYNNNYVEAIGIYKTETRSHFMDLEYNDDHTFSLVLREGVEVSAFDKGCLIFPTNAESGFDVLICDNKKGDDAVFWRDTFLKLKVQSNEYFQTNQLMTLTREFIAKQLPQEFEMDKTDQIDLLNKSVEYFRGNGSFEKAKFEQEVLHEENLIRSFQQFGSVYAENNDIEIPDSFEISTQAVKKQARVFKSVLKLDSNFHVYIHGDKSLIEKGYDDAVGKSFYKIFFDEET